MMGPPRVATSAVRSGCGFMLTGLLLTLFCAYCVYYMKLAPLAAQPSSEATIDAGTAVALVEPESSIYRPHNRSNSVTVAQIPLNGGMREHDASGMSAYLVRDDRTGCKAIVLRDRAPNGSVSLTTVADYKWLERQ